MDWTLALLLGVTQGLTEFLPISSSGHLVLLQQVFGLEAGMLSFDVFLHLGTLAAVVAAFWPDLLGILRRPFGRLTWLLLAGTIPTAAIGLTFRDLFDALFASGSTLGWEFLATGLILWWADRMPVGGGKGLDRTGAGEALFVGVMQGIAILPAISRSGLTIAGALRAGLEREFAARFSFLLSIPAILGATAIELPALGEASAAGIGTGALLVGAVAAALSGYLAIRWMLGVVRAGRLSRFSWYLWGLGLVILLDRHLTHRFF